MYSFPVSCAEPGAIGASQGNVAIMTAPTTAGFTASASLASDSSSAYMAFNGSKTGIPPPYWLCLGYSDTTSLFFSIYSTKTVTTNKGTIAGQWLQIQLPSAQTVYTR